MIKKAVITGASGFVGANLCRRLLNTNHEVHLLVRSTFNSWRIEDILNRVKLHQIDFLDQPALVKVFDTIKPDFIFHLAANGAYSFQKNTSEIFKTNILGTQNLVDASVAVGFKTFINTGSSSEYGFKKTIHSETDMLEPNSAYSVSKAAATHYCSYIANEKKLSIPTLRLYSVYGSFEDPSRLIPKLLMNAFQGNYPPLVSPETARDFIYIEDAVDAFMTMAEETPKHCSDVFNVSSGIQTTLKDVVGLIQKQFGINKEPNWGEMTSRSWDSDCWVGSNKKLKGATSWSPKYSLDQGLSDFSKWLIENPKMKQHYKL